VGVDVADAVADASARTERDAQGHLFDYMTARGLTPEGPDPEVGVRGLIRGVHDGRWKFARYFATGEHHMPRDWETLLAHNDLELYDLEADPDEIVNLAHEPDAHRELILELNAKVNALIEREIGADDGACYPGPTEAYELGV
jgi:arylsulfatase